MSNYFSKVFYHGTITIPYLGIDDLLLPPSITGNLREEIRLKRDKSKQYLDFVFISSTFHSAKKYAWKAYFKHIHNQNQLKAYFKHIHNQNQLISNNDVVMPVVYQVIPDKKSLIQMGNNSPNEWICHQAKISDIILLPLKHDDK